VAKKKVKKKTTKKKLVKKKVASPKEAATVDQAEDSKGKEKPRLTFDEIEWIKALLAVNTSKKKVADETGRSWDTIDRIGKLNEEEIEKYRDIKRKEFVCKAWEKINLLLDKVTDSKCIFATVSQITTAMGTIYDKAALASGEATDRVQHDLSDNICNLLKKCRNQRQKT
jgi:hypothetical protein